MSVLLSLRGCFGLFLCGYVTFTNEVSVGVITLDLLYQILLSQMTSSKIIVAEERVSLYDWIKLVAL